MNLDALAQRTERHVSNLRDKGSIPLGITNLAGLIVKLPGYNARSLRNTQNRQAQSRNIFAEE